MSLELMLLAPTLLFLSPALPQDPFVTSEDFLFARSLAAPGDVDGDGVPDVAIGQAAPPDGAGCVWLVSGRDGTPIRRIEPEEPDEDFGHPIAAVGDIDGDGIGDLAIASERGWDERLATVGLYSGASGRFLRGRSFGAPEDAQVRLSLAAPGDLDGDGTSDLLVGLGRSSGSSVSRRVLVLSGRDASVFRAFEEGTYGAGLGVGIAALGDVDGDGRGDLAMSLICSDPGGPGVGVVSGRDGSVLRRFCAVELREAEDAWEFGASIAAVGDVDGDGQVDLAVGAPAGDGDGSDVVRLLSVRTGEVLRAFSSDGGEFGRALAIGIAPEGGVLAVGGDSVFQGAVTCFDLPSGERRWQAGAPAGDHFGAALCAIGDVDGDGWTDFAAGCDGASSRMDGVVALVSGRRGERIWIANAAGLRMELAR